MAETHNTPDLPEEGAEPSNGLAFLHQVVASKPGGEVRKQQEIAVQKIEDALQEGKNLLLEAPTGSGKGFSYLVPALANGHRVVVSTATKQLSEQIVKSDLPLLRKIGKTMTPEVPVEAVLLKGRENYLCKAKLEETRKLSRRSENLAATLTLGGEDLFGSAPASAPKKAAPGISNNSRGAETGKLMTWAEETKNGDRSDAPAVSDETWRQFSSTSTECPGRNTCPFGSECFAEYAREKAKKANVVVTNHALVGHDIAGEADSSLFGERDAFIFDELHELDGYLTNAWGATLSGTRIQSAEKKFAAVKEVSTESLDQLKKLGSRLDREAASREPGLLKGEQPDLEQTISAIYQLLGKIVRQAAEVAKDKEESDRARSAASLASKLGAEMMEACVLLLDNRIGETVRWVKKPTEQWVPKGQKRKPAPADEEKVSLHAAPLRIGPRLQEALAARDAVMIGTSATIMVSGSFDIPIHNLALDQSSTPYETVELHTPFDFSKQAMLYVPNPDSFPAPVGADRAEHTAAVKEELVDLVLAIGGRTLGLFTTTRAAVDAGEHLRQELKKRKVKLTVLVQGEAPNSQLIDEFKQDETSVLVATAGMWQGVDVQGPALSLVVMDKIPFAPMDDPLSVARQEWAQATGRSGFMDVYVADAQAQLSQGEGRLVRSKTDRGVVAILDTRLISKKYGQTMLRTLPMIRARPSAKVFQEKKLVVNALNRLRESLENPKE